MQRPVSQRSRKGFAPESHRKIPNFMITELFYPHIPNMNRDSLHTRSVSGVYTSLFLDTDFGAFEKQASGLAGLTLLTWPVLFMHGNRTLRILLTTLCIHKRVF